MKRSRNNLAWSNRRIWKFYDDMSGAPFYSPQAVTDYRGLKTVKRFKDKQDPYLRDLKIPTEQIPPWSRPLIEGDDVSV